MPTETRPDTDPQRYLLSTVRQSQAAVIDAIRTWTTVTEQLTRSLRLPVPDVDFGGAVDRVFDVAEQTLAVQRQLALTVAGVATRQSTPPWRPSTPPWRPSRPPSARASAESRTSSKPPRLSRSSRTRSSRRP